MLCTSLCCANGLQVADEWELQWEDVEVHYNEELGTGAFGMVYRGLLHSRELRDLIDEKRGSSRRSRRGSSGRKSPRQKKLTAHRSMGSCTVAIKRLKGMCTSFFFSVTLRLMSLIIFCLLSLLLHSFLLSSPLSPSSPPDI